MITFVVSNRRSLNSVCRSGSFPEKSRLSFSWFLREVSHGSRRLTFLILSRRFPAMEIFWKLFLRRKTKAIQTLKQITCFVRIDRLSKTKQKMGFLVTSEKMICPNINEVYTTKSNLIICHFGQHFRVLTSFQRSLTEIYVIWQTWPSSTQVTLHISCKQKRLQTALEDCRKVFVLEPHAFLVHYFLWFLQEQQILEDLEYCSVKL